MTPVADEQGAANLPAEMPQGDSLSRPSSDTAADAASDIAIMQDSEVRSLVAAAREALAEWSSLSLHARADHLRNVRQAVVDNGRALAEVIASETRKPLTDAWMEVAAACHFTTWVASAGPRALRTRTVPSRPMIMKRAQVRYEPYGVVAAITPWNYPLAITFQVLPFALMAGNILVIKPSELTPRTGLLLAEVVNSVGRPLVHVVTGDGQTGEAVLRAGVDKVCFTGSGATARKVLAVAAETLTPVVMELGGKDPLIVCAGANIKSAARTAAGAAFVNAGQTCMAIERVFATGPVYDEFLERVVAETRRLHVGPEATANVGPLTRPEQLQTMEDRIRDAVARGGRVVIGGRRRPDLGPGFFEPTIVADVDPQCALMQEETFGPILPVARVKDIAEAVRLANATEFGLNCSVFAKNQSQARDIAKRIVAGGVNINDAMTGQGVPSLPFGGVKGSGYGRLHGVEGIREFAQIKSIVSNRLPGTPSMAATMWTGRRPEPRLMERLIGVAYSRGVTMRLQHLFGRAKQETLKAARDTRTPRSGRSG